MMSALVYPQIIPKSLEKSTITTDKNITQEKRYFKIFVISNQKTLPTDNEGTELIWSIDHVNTIKRDIDSFIDSGITFEANGNHPRPSRYGIHEQDYADPMHFVNDAKEFYKKKSVARVVDIYHPDSSLLNAAIADNNQTKVIWTALAETNDPEFIKELDDRENKEEPLYASPGIYALKDYREGNKSIVSQFAATHIAIVDQPAFTKPDAFIRKEICKIDKKTCRFKLLTASEMVKLNNNLDKSLTMADQTTATVPKPNETITQDETTKTEVFDSKGNKVTQESTEKKETTELKPKEDKKEEPKAVPKKPTEAQKIENKIEEKAEDIEQTPEGKLIVSKDTLKNLIMEVKKDVIKEVEDRYEAKNEKVLKVETLNSFINSEGKDLKEEYDFYSKLNVSSSELKHILENSKYAAKDKKGKSMYASTSGSAEVSSYSEKNDNTRQASTLGNQEVNLSYSGEAIPERYR